VCCSVLQYVAVCCSMLPCVAVCCSVLQCVAAQDKERAEENVRQRESCSLLRCSLLRGEENVRQRVWRGKCETERESFSVAWRGKCV